jgi:hypothetical protein
LPDCIPALPSIKLALFLSSMKGGGEGASIGLRKQKTHTIAFAWNFSLSNVR